jgi:predicted SAM-dependent methyltransferase
MLKLHIGCGLKYKKEYINIDAYDDTVADVIMKADNLDYDDQTVDLIESYQLVEHLGYMNTVLTLGEWFRVLKNNSSLILETPDIDKTFELYLKTNDHIQKATILNWIFGLPTKGYEHKFCFPAGLLRKMLIEAGFVDIMEKYHEKTFGVPTYNFIAKKPLETNPNYRLIHRLRKRVFSEVMIFQSTPGENYQLDFEKAVLLHTVDYTPRDFSVITFNEIFINCLAYSLQATEILVEESHKLKIITSERSEALQERIKLLHNYRFTRYLYALWEHNLYTFKNPNKAYLITSEFAKNIARMALFEPVITEFEKNLSQTMIPLELEPVLDEENFSGLYIEDQLSKYFARFIKGCASEPETKLCNALAISTL